MTTYIIFLYCKTSQNESIKNDVQKMGKGQSEEVTRCYGIILKKDKTLMAFRKCFKNGTLMLELLKNKHTDNKSK